MRLLTCSTPAHRRLPGHVGQNQSTEFLYSINRCCTWCLTPPHLCHCFGGGLSCPGRCRKAASCEKVSIQPGSEVWFESEKWNMCDFFPCVASVLTTGLGLMGLVRPDLVSRMVGIEAVSQLGKSEVRATYGGVFVGLGASCLWLQSTEAFLVVGIAWSTAALVRTADMVFEREFSSKNIGGVGIEGGVGAMFLSVMF